MRDEAGRKDLPDLSGCAVLVVEDDYFLAGEICAGLERAGASPIGPAGTVEEGLELARGAKLDCAVLDIKLRDQPSYALARELERRGLPFVYVTGYDETLVPQESRGVAHLVKPVDVYRLLRLVAELCRSPHPARS